MSLISLLIAFLGMFGTTSARADIGASQGVEVTKRDLRKAHNQANRIAKRTYRKSKKTESGRHARVECEAATLVLYERRSHQFDCLIGVKGGGSVWVYAYKNDNFMRDWHFTFGDELLYYPAAAMPVYEQDANMAFLIITGDKQPTERQIKRAAKRADVLDVMSINGQGLVAPYGSGRALKVMYR